MLFFAVFLNVLKAYGIKKCLEKNKLNFPHLFLEGVAFDDKKRKWACQINGKILGIFDNVIDVGCMHAYVDQLINKKTKGQRDQYHAFFSVLAAKAYDTQIYYWYREDPDIVGFLNFPDVCVLLVAIGVFRTVFLN